MSMRSFDAAILAELRIVEKNRKIRQKDILAWQLGQPLKREADDEVHVFLPLCGAHVCYRKP